MRLAIFLCLLVAAFGSCRKNHNSGKGGINFYVLTSFTPTYDSSTRPWRFSVSDPVLSETPFIEDRDIMLYHQATHTYTLRKNVKPSIEKLAGDKAFAVTFDGKAVYYGKFHPGYYSSIAFGVPTIDPIIHTTENSLSVQFVTTTAMMVDPFDKRNDPVILSHLSATRRLR